MFFGQKFIPAQNSLTGVFFLSYDKNNLKLFGESNLKLSEINPLFWVAMKELMEQGYEFEFKTIVQVDFG